MNEITLGLSYSFSLSLILFGCESSTMKSRTSLLVLDHMHFYGTCPFIIRTHTNISNITHKLDQIWDKNIWPKVCNLFHMSKNQIKQGVCHTTALPLTLKGILKAKEKLRKLKIFHHTKIYNLKKKPLKETKNPSRYHNSITNLKFQQKPKISSFKNPHIKIDLLLPKGPKSLKLRYSMRNLNTINILALVGQGQQTSWEDLGSREGPNNNKPLLIRTLGLGRVLITKNHFLLGLWV